MKKGIVAVLLPLAMLLAVTLGGFDDASAATKQINADYQDVKIFVNGNVVTVQPNEEPFIYNGRTFVPIRVISEAMKMNVEWIGATKYVKITGGGDSNTLSKKIRKLPILKHNLHKEQ